MTTANKSLAFGVIRKGAIPNPSIGRQVARENNPKEILGIFVNPDESKPKAKRGSTMKKKRKTAARPKKKRSAPSRSAAPRRRAKKVSTRSTARARRPRRKNPNLAAGYEAPAREVNARPRKRKATSKRRAPKRRASSKGKMSAAQVRNLLRSVAKRIKNSSAPRGRTAGQRSGLSASSFGATEIRRAGLLDGAFQIQELDNEIEILQGQVAASSKDRDLQAVYARELAQKVSERERLLGGLGFLDAAIVGSSDPALESIRTGLTQAAAQRRQQAAARAVVAGEYKPLDKKRMEYFAALAIAIASKESGTTNLLQNALSYFPRLAGKQYTVFDVATGAPEKGKAQTNLSSLFYTAPRFADPQGKQELLLLPKEAIHHAISSLQANSLPMAFNEDIAKIQSNLSIVLERLHGVLEGRVWNPGPRRKRRSKKRKATRGRKRRRTSNPAPKRRKRKKSSAASSYKKRSKKRGRRRRNPRGTEMIARLVSGQASIGDMLAVAGAAVGGYVAVGAGEWILQAVGVDKMLANLAGNSAQVGSALTAVASGAATALLAWGAGKAVKGVENIEAPLYIGIASRVVVNLIDAFARTPSEATRLLRSAAGLPPTVGSYGRWNPNMDGYYNFQPVMAGAARRAGYSVSNFANKAGYALQGAAQRAGYSVGGYSNFAPRVNGYNNFAPRVNGYSNFAPAVNGYSNFAPKLNQNPFGSAFGKPW